jgi:hypothetical protein
MRKDLDASENPWVVFVIVSSRAKVLVSKPTLQAPVLKVAQAALLYVGEPE